MSKLALEAKDRGNAAYKNGDYAAAHACYDEAIRLSPQVMIFFSNKGAVFFEEGKYDDCVATCETALDVGSEDKTLVAKVMTRIAKAKNAQGKTSEAIAWMEKALSEHRSPEITKLLTDLRLAAQRRRLSTKYGPELFPLLMKIPNDDRAGSSVRKLVLSSPVMTKAFVQFMKPFTITVKDPIVVHFYGREFDLNPMADATYVKKWTPFSWIAPFIEKLAMDFDSPDRKAANWAYDILPRITNVLTFFELWLPDEITGPLHPSFLPFIQRQLPNLQILHGPIELFFALPPNPAQPKKFEEIGVVVRKFTDLPKLFKTKRFTSPLFEFKFVQPPNSGVNFASTFTAFLKKMTVRQPETFQVIVRMPVLGARFPAASLVKALYTVFPGLQTLVFFVDFHVASYDREQLANNYTFLKKEMTKMPPEFRVNIRLEEYVRFFNIFATNFLINPPTGFTARSAFSQAPWMPACPSFFNTYKDVPVCHGNKSLHYDVFFLD